MSQKNLAYLIMLMSITPLCFSQSNFTDASSTGYQIRAMNDNSRMENYHLHLKIDQNHKFFKQWGVTASQSKLVFGINEFEPETLSFNNYYSLGVNNAISFLLKSNATLLLESNLRVSSTFNTPLSSDDLFSQTRLLVALTSDSQSDRILKLGLGYGAFWKRNAFWPIISFQSKINSQWGFDIGFPACEIYYAPKPSKKIAFKANFDGLVVNDGNVNQATVRELTQQSVDLSLEYHWVTEYWSTQLSLGYALNNHFELTQNGTPLFEYESHGGILLGLNIGFNLKSIFKNQK